MIDFDIKQSIIFASHPYPFLFIAYQDGRNKLFMCGWRAIFLIMMFTILLALHFTFVTFMKKTVTTGFNSEKWYNAGFASFSLIIPIVFTCPFML